MQYSYTFGVNASLVRVPRHSLFHMIVGTAIALVALLSPASMAIASMHIDSLTNRVAASATNVSPQVQAVYGTNGSFTTPGMGACTATSFTEGAGVALDSSGGLYIAD